MQLFGAAQHKLVERVVTPVGPADGPSVATCFRCCLKGLKGQAANAGTRRCKGNWSLPASKVSTTSLEGLDSLNCLVAQPWSSWNGHPNVLPKGDAHADAHLLSPMVGDPDGGSERQPRPENPG
jgi:hypothetical protein